MASIFRRPKKPIRPRVITTDPDGDDDEVSACSKLTIADTPAQKEIKIVKSVKSEIKSEKKQSLLSFDDDLKEDEEGEIFRVKKSSVSRRLMKQRDREKKESRKPFQNNVNVTETKDITSQSSQRLNENSCETKEDLTGIDDKNFIRILTGREAEAVDMESGSEDEDDGHYQGGPQYSRRLAREKGSDVLSDTLRRTLEQAQIPDANLVHEVRKRRQMARNQGGVPAFIAVNNVDRQAQKSRLVREDDENDHSDDDDDRLDFSVLKNTANADRERRKEVFEAAQEDEQISKSDDDSEAEMDEWESQQLRKGVSKSQMSSVAIEVKQQKYFRDKNSAPAKFKSNNNKPMDALVYRSDLIKPRPDIPDSVESVMNGSNKQQLTLVLEEMKKSLDHVQDFVSRKERECSGMRVDMELASKEIIESTADAPVLSSKHTLYQKLRGYVTDLVDCLHCKIPVIEDLENRMSQLMKTRLDRLVERRRQDVRDQLQEVNTALNLANSGNSSSIPLVQGDGRSRRAAEREGRRTRRRRIREIKGVSLHKDGLSSDDEETELETNSFKAQKEQIIQESSLVFDDVSLEFSCLESALARFHDWRIRDLASYLSGFRNVSIAHVIGFYVRLSLLDWDPLWEDSDLTDCNWIKSLAMNGFTQNETLQALGTDPDIRTIPNVMEEVLLPWLEVNVKVMWDPTSVRQTRRLVNLVRKLINEWSVGASCVPMHNLMCSIISKFKDAVDNDVYIPIFPKSAIANKCTPASVFSSRQFWASVKILDNISAWTGLLSDKPLQILALDALLTRYILLGLRTAVDLAESAERASGVVKVLPRLWLTQDGNVDEELPNGIQQLIRCLIFVVQSSDCTLAANRMAVPEIAASLKTLGAITESETIVSKYG